MGGQLVNAVFSGLITRITIPNVMQYLLGKLAGMSPSIDGLNM